MTFIDRTGAEHFASFQWRRPVVIAIDEATRSGKEVFAWALQRAGVPLVGARTPVPCSAPGHRFSLTVLSCWSPSRTSESRTNDWRVEAWSRTWRCHSRFPMRQATTHRWKRRYPKRPVAAPKMHRRRCRNRQGDDCVGGRSRPPNHDLPERTRCRGTVISSSGRRCPGRLSQAQSEMTFLRISL